MSICGTVVLVYPRLRFLLRTELARELKGVFLALSTKGASLDAVLKPVTVQALVRTISSATDDDLRSLVGRFDASTGLTDNRLLPYYLELWTTVLTITNPDGTTPAAGVVDVDGAAVDESAWYSGRGAGEGGGARGGDAGDRALAALRACAELPSMQRVFNELMGNVVEVTRRLDLSFVAHSDHDGVGELNATGRPRNAKDCALFHNLVRLLLRLLLPSGSTPKRAENASAAAAATAAATAAAAAAAAAAATATHSDGHCSDSPWYPPSRAVAVASHVLHALRCPSLPRQHTATTHTNTTHARTHTHTHTRTHTHTHTRTHDRCVWWRRCSPAATLGWRCRGCRCW